MSLEDRASEIVDEFVELMEKFGPELTEERRASLKKDFEGVNEAFCKAYEENDEDTAGDAEYNALEEMEAIVSQLKELVNKS